MILDRSTRNQSSTTVPVHEANVRPRAESGAWA
jgi:hypothetical protein